MDKKLYHLGGGEVDYTKEAEELYPLHDVFSKDEREAHIKAREMSAKEIEELKREIERLKMDNMAHEYNQAEAQRFAPEYERQIREDEADKWREQVSKLREGLGHILKEYEHSCKLMAEANGMFWSENNVSISAKQLLNETK